MNIFVLDADPVTAAWMLHPMHFGRPDPRKAWGCPKMAVEGLQMLAGAFHRWGWPTGISKVVGGIYSPDCHPHHRCSKWVREHLDHAAWLLRHVRAICDHFDKEAGKSPSVLRSVISAESLFSALGGTLDRPAPKWFVVADGVHSAEERLPPDETVMAYREYYTKKVGEHDKKYATVV